MTCDLILKSCWGSDFARRYPDVGLNEIDETWEKSITKGSFGWKGEGGRIE